MKSSWATIGKIGAAVVVLHILGASYPLAAQNASKGTEASCRKTVQSFYDWYAPKINVEDKDWHIALNERGQLFGKVLTQALKYSDVESKIDGDPVLDFDPIVNSQDPGDHYTVRGVTVNRSRCSARVYGVWSRPVPNNGQTPNVVAELVLEKGQWVFVNFSYPGTGDFPTVNLLQILGYHYQDRPAQAK